MAAQRLRLPTVSAAITPTYPRGECVPRFSPIRAQPPATNANAFFPKSASASALQPTAAAAAAPETLAAAPNPAGAAPPSPAIAPRLDAAAAPSAAHAKIQHKVDHQPEWLAIILQFCAPDIYGRTLPHLTETEIQPAGTIHSPSQPSDPAVGGETAALADATVTEAQPEEQPVSQGDRPSPVSAADETVTPAQPGEQPASQGDRPDPVSAPPRPACASDRIIMVDTIAVTCSTILTEAIVADILQPFLGRPLSLAEQGAAADVLTRYYLEQGYITSRAEVQALSDQDDRLQLTVIEGGIERIEIDGLRRLQEGYLRSRLTLVTQPPVNTARLEDQLRLLRQSPLLDNIEASLRPGGTYGSSILQVRVEEADPFDGFIGLDNYSPPVLGTTQGTLALSHQNLTGRGDRLAGSIQRTTTGGGSTYTLGYAIPLNAMEGTIQVQGSWEQNYIPLAPGLDIIGNSQTYSLSFRQPLTRTPREELALSLGFDYKNSQTALGDQPFGFGLGPDPNTGISRTAVLRFGQDYISRDEQGAWAVRSRFSLGTGLLGATVNPGSIPDGRFISWLGQIQRVRRLSDDHLLVMSADVQLTPDPLLPSEKFVIGGATTVRGYRQNLRGGDNGFRLSVEDRITLNRDEAGLPTLQLAPFVDMGSIWNVADNPNPAPVQGLLASLGLGLIWEPIPRLSLRVDYGLPLVGTPNRGNTWQEQGIYFQLGYRL